MELINKYNVNKKLAEALGIDTKLVTKFTVFVAVGEPIRIEVKSLILDDIDKIANDIKTVLKKYELTEIKDE